MYLFHFHIKKNYRREFEMLHANKKWRKPSISSFILLSSRVEMEKSCNNILFPWFITHFVRYLKFYKKHLKKCELEKKFFTKKKKRKKKRDRQMLVKLWVTVFAENTKVRFSYVGSIVWKFSDAMKSFRRYVFHQNSNGVESSPNFIRIDCSFVFRFLIL